MSIRRGRLSAALTAVLVVLFTRPAVQAHGQPVNVAVSCVSPHAGRPLLKVCTAVLKYVDGDAVLGARVELTAAREQKRDADVLSALFAPTEQAGVYSSTILFPAYGRWRLRFGVGGPIQGGAELVQELLPPLPGATPQTSARLQIVLRFGLPDVRNIAVRTLHLLAAAAWFGLVVLLLVLLTALPPELRWDRLHRMARRFPWAAAASLVVVAATGIYTARYNAPAPAPGLFAPRSLARLPFGGSYLAVFGVKMSLMLAIAVSTFALAVLLRRAYGRSPTGIAGAAADPLATGHAADRPLARLAWAALALGLLVFADVVVLGYLHIITHLAAAAGGR